MKKQVHYNERGQALILIAFAVVGLVAFTALSIDGGRVFSDRRHSQNASDTSALAAALERVRRPTEDWQSIARSRAADNGYSSSDGITQVNVYLCSDLPQTVDGYTMTCKGLPSGADPSEYVYVHIKSVVDLMFARIIGWRTITNHTDAVARAKVPVTTSWANGNGIWATKTDCKSPGEGDPFKLGGSANNKVLGSGILVNASCATSDSFVQSGHPKLYTDKGVCVHGTSDYIPGDVTSGTGSAMTEGCPAIDPSSYQMPPAPDCTNPGKIVSAAGGEYVAYPGYYDKTGNKKFPDVNGQATVRLIQGVYCLYNGLGVNAGITLTTDTNKSGSFNPATEGVLFYLPGTESGDDIQINGGATLDLHAIHETTWTWFDDSWLNLLIYVNPAYAPDVDISGSSGSTYTGTILAPSANVHLLGNNGTDAGTVTLDSQIIANTVELSGNTSFVLIYNEDNNATTLYNPEVSVTE